MGQYGGFMEYQKILDFYARLQPTGFLQQVSQGLNNFYDEQVIVGVGTIIRVAPASWDPEEKARIIIPVLERGEDFGTIIYSFLHPQQLTAQNLHRIMYKGNRDVKGCPALNAKYDPETRKIIKIDGWTEILFPGIDSIHTNEKPYTREDGEGTLEEFIRFHMSGISLAHVRSYLIEKKNSLN